MASSTKTHYFETSANEIRVDEFLKKMLENGELTYYRYIGIPNSLWYGERQEYGIRKTTVTWSLKLCGVVQFKERVSPRTVRQMFVSERIYLSALLTVRRPIVLILMRLWVLCGCYGLHYGETKWSNTPIGFGGRKTENEVHYMKPYIKALIHYRECDRDDFCYNNLNGARQICKYKLMLEKKLRKTSMPI
ncbi:Hypothetical predicted protein [Paramuricea clavata]|uniref:Uncharacterized protein n=1 Tax=Paramuricea clavata TaxID=317549 RepID=A0A7D9E014_PARCT|nr:Hypothetical predicted protein [Paramuricea clavata]